MRNIFQDRAKLASCVAITYIFIVLGGIILHFLNTGGVYTLKFSLLLPSTWGATLLSGVVAWGLWDHFRWAWWLGIVAVLFQLIRMSFWLSQRFSLDDLPGFGTLLVFALLIIFLVLLILPATRALCKR